MSTLRQVQTIFPPDEEQPYPKQELKFPTIVQKLITGYLSPKDVLNLSATCKKMRKFVREDPGKVINQWWFYQYLLKQGLAPIQQFVHRAGESVTAQCLHEYDRWNYGGQANLPALQARAAALPSVLEVPTEDAWWHHTHTGRPYQEATLVDQLALKLLPAAHKPRQRSRGRVFTYWSWSISCVRIVPVKWQYPYHQGKHYHVYDQTSHWQPVYYPFNHKIYLEKYDPTVNYFWKYVDIKYDAIKGHLDIHKIEVKLAKAQQKVVDLEAQRVYWKRYQLEQGKDPNIKPKPAYSGWQAFIKWWYVHKYEFQSQQNHMAACAQAWRALSDEERANWDDKAVILSKKDGRQVPLFKKPKFKQWTGYLLFGQEYSAANNFTYTTLGDRSRQLSEAWRELSDEQRDEYNERAYRLLTPAQHEELAVYRAQLAAHRAQKAAEKVPKEEYLSQHEHYLASRL